MLVSFDRADAGTLYIDIHYSIRGSNDPRNLVFPFYVIPEEPEPAAVTAGRRLRRELACRRTEWLIMVLPAPNLDDRHFQDLVDDAKRLVQQRCPEWTDHNVSDPGVTLIEAFAQMVDQLIYRLNRVPDRNYIKFLELIGVELRPPAAARGQGDVLAVGAAAADRRGPPGDRGGHAAHRCRRPGRLLHRQGPGHRAVLVRPGRRDVRRRRGGRPQHRAAVRRRIRVLPATRRSRATRC